MIRSIRLGYRNPQSGHEWVGLGVCSQFLLGWEVRDLGVLIREHPMSEVPWG